MHDNTFRDTHHMALGYWEHPSYYPWRLYKYELLPQSSRRSQTYHQPDSNSNNKNLEQYIKRKSDFTVGDRNITM